MRFQEWCVASIAAMLAWSCQPTEQSVRESRRGFSLPAGDAEAGRVAFEEMRCYTCHEVAGLEDELPRPTATPVSDVKLGGLAMRAPTDGELVSAVINPSHQIYAGGEEERVMTGAGSRMADYNEILTVQQLIDIVAFLHERYETTRE